MNIRKKIEEACAHIARQMPFAPQAAVILGSGLGNFVNRLPIELRIPARAIPHYPIPAVPGHAGELIWTRAAQTNIVVLRGRVHMYEGYSAQEVTFPVQVVASLGAKQLVVTNAAGAVNPDFRPGDLMLIRDHVNFAFQNPLVGPESEQLGPRFPDMTRAYSPRLLELARTTAEQLDVPLKEGVLFGLLGPTYETMAEALMIRVLGGDAATMSTVPEVIVAVQRGLEVLGLSVITNTYKDAKKSSVAHEDVIQIANRVQETFGKLLERILRNLPRP